MDYAKQHQAEGPATAQQAASDVLGAFGDAAAGQSTELLTQKPVLRWGSTGPAVNECQRKLNLAGAQLVEDGQFGPATHKAVVRFQSARKLAVDGVVGPNTWAALDAGHQANLGDEGGGKGGADLVDADKGGPEPAGPADHTTQALLPGHQSTPGAAHGREAMLDDANLIGGLLMADTSEFSGYVASGVLSQTLANVLALMRDLGGDTQYSYGLAKDGLANGTLLGMVFNRDRDALLNSKLAPNDPDKAEFRTLSATNTGAVFANNTRNTRGLILVGDAHTLSTRSLILDLAHELNHYRNEAVSDVIEQDASRDIADGVATVTPQQLGETRRAYVDEVVARHVEWWAAWTVRTERVGGSVADIDPPAPDRLFAACVDLALNFMGDAIYDPYRYWEALVSRGDDSVERQVGQWLTFVPQEQMSGNPYRDMQSHAAFLAASVLRTATAKPDGLGGDIDV